VFNINKSLDISHKVDLPVS